MGSILTRIREIEEDEIADIERAISAAKMAGDEEQLTQAERRLAEFRERYSGATTNNYVQGTYYLP